MSETREQAIRRVAGNQIAKCVARGTVGALYVPVGVARRAFPKSDHAVYDEALDLLDREGFLMWHKNNSCFGLAPTRYGQAVEFALANADEKRRATLVARIPSALDPEVTSPVAPQQQDWSDDEDIERNDPILRESDVERLGLPRKDWVMQRIIESAQRPGNLDPAATASTIGKLSEENHRLRSEVGTLRSQLAAQADDIAALKARFGNVEKDAAELAKGAQDVSKFVEEYRHRNEQRKVAAGQECIVNRCGAKAAKPIPVYYSNGFGWKKGDKAVHVCDTHAAHGYSLCFHKGRVVDASRLVARLPKLSGLPVMCGPVEVGRLIVSALVEAGRVKRSEANNIRGIADECEPVEWGDLGGFSAVEIIVDEGVIKGDNIANSGDSEE